MRVNAARHQFLAGAVLAEDEHAAVGGRGHAPSARAGRSMTWLSPTIVCCASTRARSAMFSASRLPLPQGVAHDEHGLLERQRLLDEVERAHLDGAHRRLDVAVAGDHHHLRVDLAARASAPAWPGRPSPAARCRARRRRRAVAPGAPGRPRRSRPRRRRSLRRAARPRARCARRVRRRRSGSDMASYAVVRQERRAPGCPHTAARSTNRVPRGTLSVTSMLPPCSATMRRTIASPRPLPRCLVE